MKKRILSLLCALVMILSLPVVACAADAEPRASYYFSCTDVRAYAEDNGRILIEIDVDATHTMQEVGASDVWIYEVYSNGDYEIVYSYTKEDYPNLIWTNSTCAYVDVTYQGTVGKQYFATVACYAKDSEGAERRYYDTNLVTAVQVEAD